MKHHFDLEPLDTRDPRLVFDWNSQTGEVTGPGAHMVREFAIPGLEVPVPPHPFGWKLSADPLRSVIDLAALLSGRWRLTPELLAACPQPIEDPRAGENAIY